MMKPVIDMQVRASPRRRCSIQSHISYFNQRVECRVVDVSDTGIAVELGSPIAAAAGSKVTVENNDFGRIEGTVKWVRSGKVGVEFSRDTNTVAKMAAYFRNFHQEYQPTISR